MPRATGQTAATSGRERDVVGDRDRAVGRELNHGRRRAGRRGDGERRGVELVLGGDIERLLGVVLGHLGDDFLHRVQRQVVELFGLGHRVAVLGNRHRALGDGVVGLGRVLVRCRRGRDRAAWRSISRSTTASARTKRLATEHLRRCIEAGLAVAR